QFKLALQLPRADGYLLQQLMITNSSLAATNHLHSRMRIVVPLYMPVQLPKQKLIGKRYLLPGVPRRLYLFTKCKQFPAQHIYAIFIRGHKYRRWYAKNIVYTIGEKADTKYLYRV